MKKLLRDKDWYKPAILGLIIIVPVALLLAGVIFGVPNQGRSSDWLAAEQATSMNAPMQDEHREQISPLELTPEQYEEAKQVYKTPEMIALRTIFDGYLKGKPPMWDGKLDDYVNEQLAPYTDYFKSKFILLDISDNPFGGVEGRILFKDNPDQVFYFWLYKTDYWRVYGFMPYNKYMSDESKQMNESDIEDIRTYSKHALEDPNFGL